MLRAFPAAVLLGVCAVYAGGCQLATPAAPSAAAAAFEQPLLRPGGPAESEPLPEQPTLQDYLRYAALHNPGLEAAYNSWQAALARVPQVSTMPDPRFTYRYYIEKVETRVGPQKEAFNVSQTFPWFGKLALRGREAVEESEAARQMYELSKRQLFYRVKRAYYEYFYLHRAIVAVTGMRDLMVQLEAAVRALYRAGGAQNSDVVRAQVELGKLEDRVRSLEDMRDPIRARLNAALNRPADADLPWPETFEVQPLTASDDELLKAAAEANPELLAMAHRIARQDLAVSLALKDYWPDVMLGLDYIDTGKALMPGTRDSGKDPIIASIGINVPIWLEKRDAAVREARARFAAEKHARTERENGLLAEVKMALYGMRDADRKVNLYRDTLTPKARQALEVTETAYRAGQADFNALMDAERILLEFELSYERARADGAQRLAELEMLVGADALRGSPAAEPDGGAKEKTP